MKKKSLVMLGLIAGLSVLSAVPAFAGEWKQDSKGWRYQENNGAFQISTWKWIDGNNDGIAECYYFDQSGYALMNTVTPDNYTVNADGAWTVNGVVQTKQADTFSGAVREIDLEKAKGKYRMVEASQNGVEMKVSTNTADLILVKDSKYIAWGYTGASHEIIPDIDTNKWQFLDGGILTLVDEETVDLLTWNQIHYVFKKIK